MAPSTLFGAGSAIYSALLYTDRRFVIPGLYQTCLNGATIAGGGHDWRCRLAWTMRGTGNLVIPSGLHDIPSWR